MADDVEASRNIRLRKQLLVAVRSLQWNYAIFWSSSKIQHGMTSGVVYSIVMHSLIITAYVLLMFQIFCTNEFDDLDQIMDVIGFSFFHLIFVVAEVAFRWYCEDPLVVTKSGHFGHFNGAVVLTAYLVPINPFETILFDLVEVALPLWTIFVFAASFIPACIAFDKNDSLTEPLV